MSSNRRQFLSGVSAAAVACLSDLRAECAAAIVAADPGETPAWDALRAQYLLAEPIVYLNHASIGTIPRAVHQARVKYLELCETNPWLYMWGGHWEEPREEVRRSAAAYLGCSADQLAITHNTTEAFNLLAHGLPLRPTDEVLWSSLAHSGSTEPFKLAARRGRLRVRSFAFPLERAPQLTAEEIVALYSEQMRAETRVLILPHVDNMIGVRHPIAELVAAARQRGVEFVAVDAAQSVAMLPVDVSRWDADLVATSPHKWLQAPKGLGLAVIHPRLQKQLVPFWVTWGQTRWRGTVRVFEDYGTRNHAEVLALGHAVAFQQQIADGPRQQRLQQLWRAGQQVSEQLGLRWKSPRNWECGASLFAVEVPGRDSSEVCARIQREAGFVVRPFGGDLNTLRISPNVVNTPQQIEDCLVAARGQTQSK